MTATVGFPTLRLVRWAIEDLTADGMRPADVRPVPADALFAGLRLKP